MDGTGPYSLSLPGPLHLMPLVSRLPSSFSVSRFGRPSDHHHHRLPHHGHSCSDYNSCLKKLVRTLGPSGWVMGVSGGPWGSTHRVSCFSTPPQITAQGIISLEWRVPHSSCPAQPTRLCPDSSATQWEGLFPDSALPVGFPAWLNSLGSR